MKTPEEQALLAAQLALYEHIRAAPITPGQFATQADWGRYNRERLAYARKDVTIRQRTWKALEAYARSLQKTEKTDEQATGNPEHL